MWLISCWVVGNLRDLLMLLDDMCRTVWDREWLDEFWREDGRERWHCCWIKEWGDM